MAGRFSPLANTVKARADGVPGEPNFRRYQSHKIVEAAPIIAAEFNEDGSGKVVIRDADDMWHSIPVPPGFKRPNTEPVMDPDGGDYLVRYDGGYLSWSPREKFETGYTEI